MGLVALLILALARCRRLLKAVAAAPVAGTSDGSQPAGAVAKATVAPQPSGEQLVAVTRRVGESHTLESAPLFDVVEPQHYGWMWVDGNKGVMTPSMNRDTGSITIRGKAAGTQQLELRVRNASGAAGVT